MKRLLLCTMLLLTFPMVACATLNALNENFSGPSLDASWGTIEGGGTFNGSGQYTISDNGTKPVVGITRSTGDGDFEMFFDSNLSLSGANTKLGFEIWDAASGGGINGFLVHMFTVNGTSYILDVYQWVNGAFAARNASATISSLERVSYRLTWNEGIKSWGLSYGLNGAPSTTNLVDLTSLPAYTASSSDARVSSIWVDHWTSGSMATANLDNYNLQVPEPLTITILGLGGLLLRSRKRTC